MFIYRLIIPISVLRSLLRSWLDRPINVIDSMVAITTSTTCKYMLLTYCSMGIHSIEVVAIIAKMGNIALTMNFFTQKPHLIFANITIAMLLITFVIAMATNAQYSGNPIFSIIYAKGSAGSRQHISTIW